MEKRVSSKERFKIAALIFFIIFSLSILKLLGEFQNIYSVEEKHSTSKKIKLSELSPKYPTRTVIAPFKEEPKILESVVDDEYLKIKPFYYLIHKIISSSEKEIIESLDSKLGWNDIKKLAGREKLRGKIMRIRGGFEHLSREEVKDEIAKEFGIEGMEYWQGLIFTSDGLPYRFAITEFPKDINLGDDVEFIEIGRASCRERV